METGTKTKKRGKVGERNNEREMRRNKNSGDRKES